MHAPTSHNDGGLKSINIEIKDEVNFGHTLEIVYDNITYITPCDFFSYTVSIEESKKGPFIFVNPIELDDEFERFYDYKDDFNHAIFRESVTKVKRGKAKTDFYITEQRSRTVDMYCRDFIFVFDTSILHTTKNNGDSVYNLNEVNSGLERFEDAKKRYNEKMAKCKPSISSVKMRN